MKGKKKFPSPPGVPVAPPPHFAAPSPKPPPDATCWVCLDGNDTRPSSSNDAATGPLLRNCACRGTGGFAHASCVAENARRVAEAAFPARLQGGRSSRPPPSKVSLAVTKAWMYCPNCEQEYLGDMSLAMAEKWAESAAHLNDADFPRFDALQRVGLGRFDCGDYAGAIQTFESLVSARESSGPAAASATGAARSTRSPATAVEKYFLEQRAETLQLLATTYVRRMTANPFIGPNDVTRAKQCLKEAHGIFASTFGPDDMRTMQAKMMLQDFNGRSHTNSAAVLKERRREYKKSVRSDGADSAEALSDVACLAKALVEDGKAAEAKALLKKSVPKAKRVFGPSHPTAISMEDLLKDVEAGNGAKVTSGSSIGDIVNLAEALSSPFLWATIVGHRTKPALNGKKVQVLRRTKDGEKFVVLLVSDGCDGDEGGAQKFKAVSANLVFGGGTRFIVRDLKASAHLNGKDGVIESFDNDNGRYVVKIGNEPRCRLKRDNIEIDFST
mmetsp:Transcript_23161/g.50193  ORF Transcript_23161/g.50193 Transcript_23161/m.50193 type:complete len:501 (-) Transcript_23161:219-1721(-)